MPQNAALRFAFRLRHSPASPVALARAPPQIRSIFDTNTEAARFHDHIAELRAERRAIKAELGRLSPRAAAMEGASIGRP